MFNYNIGWAYEELRKWYEGSSRLSEVELHLGTKVPFLFNLYESCGMISHSETPIGNFQFQDYVNVMTIYLSWLALRGIRQLRPAQPKAIV